MTRLFCVSLAGVILLSGVAPGSMRAQNTSSPAASQSQEPVKPGQDDANPPEEDESRIPEKVPLNPMEAERSIQVGNYYMHKGNPRAALHRYELASKYNPSSPDAFFKIGEAEEKLKDGDAAKLAFKKVVRLAPNTKLAEEAQKKLKKKS